MTRPLTTWTATQLALEHSRINRWLDLPGSHLWLDDYKSNLAQMEAIWAEMQGRKRFATPALAAEPMKASERRAA